jgi:hypothetical protein
MKLKTETYTLPSHWASYLINGDPTSFDLYKDGDAEIKRIDRFLKRNNLGFCLDCSEDEEFSWSNDAGELAGSTAEFTFEVLT